MVAVVRSVERQRQEDTRKEARTQLLRRWNQCKRKGQGGEHGPKSVDHKEVRGKKEGRPDFLAQGCARKRGDLVKKNGPGKADVPSVAHVYSCAGRREGLGGTSHQKERQSKKNEHHYFTSKKGTSRGAYIRVGLRKTQGKSDQTENELLSKGEKPKGPLVLRPRRGGTKPIIS